MSKQERSRRSTRHQSSTLSLGLEIQKESLAVAYVAQAHHAEVVSRGPIGTRQGARDPLIRKRQAQSKHLLFVYEAGPCGDWLSRSLPQKGQVCWGVAPSLRPQKPGDRGKPKRRDASKLARLRRSGALPPVSGPQVEDAAMRDLGRARAETSRALQAAQCQRTALLLRHDLRSTGRAPWRPAHLRWLSEVGWPTPAQPSVCQADVRAVTAHPARLARLAHALTDPGQTGRLAPVDDALQALRGVHCTVAVRTGAARGDLPRFAHPRQRRHSLGVTPSASSTGERRPPGGSPPDGPEPCPPGPGRRRLGLALPRHKQPASALPPGEGTQADPR